MKALIVSFLLAFILLTGTAFTYLTWKEADKGFALVELFTSEGCSSCPPADALVAKISKETLNRPVYILSFHVDYWNRLGWKDVYSKAEFSARQKRYTDWMHLSGAYTPQIVVNGKTEMVGSNENALRRAVTAGLKNTSAAILTFKEASLSQQKLQLQYQVLNAADNYTLNIAFVQKQAQTQVKAGENAGKTLPHINIVRELKTIPLNGHQLGTAAITPPENFNLKDGQVISFIQNSSTGEIMTAKEVQLSAI
ncbi:thioredoxin family protein [Mucilaginibacter galii]|uniref:DUF1223 domain-containing protein n=1 Tax=Mucilaginibacter galii TaxID=2005073 RepID=A0A917N1M2_9SPHI|nr:DUF1223 domain-containing protein [Mucilaginibacter galii]GGI49177.1 hypothetical protein GCM10011425_03890 [Mucilaginibacter galii]